LKAASQYHRAGLEDRAGLMKLDRCISDKDAL
jgi:hypothetical protein